MEDWGRRGPSCLVGVGNEAQGLDPEAQKPLPFYFSSQIILEAGQRVPWAPLPRREPGPCLAAPHPTVSPGSPCWPEHASSGGGKGVWEHQ